MAPYCSSYRLAGERREKTDISHPWPEDELVDVPGEHGGGREDGGVGRGHDGGRHGAQPEEGDEGGREVLQHHRQDHARVVSGDRAVVVQGALVARLCPVC